MSTKKKVIQRRRYLLTLWDWETVPSVVSAIESLSPTYFILSREIGMDSGDREHMHIYMEFPFSKKFSVISKALPGAHIEVAFGSSKENRDYILKEGNYLNDTKHGTKIPGSEIEFGEISNSPREAARGSGGSFDLATLYTWISEGRTNSEIFASNPLFIRYANSIDRIRFDIQKDKLKGAIVPKDVTYIWGKSGTGKSHYAIYSHGIENVYRVTDYDHPFDAYAGEKVLILEEFRSSLPLGEMLNILDKWPCQLRARYSNKYSAFDKVYIISNIPLELQYQNIQNDGTDNWSAFLNRITRVIRFDEFATPVVVFDRSLDVNQDTIL